LGGAFNEEYDVIDADIQTGLALQEALEVARNLGQENAALQQAQQTVLGNVYDRWRWLFEPQSIQQWTSRYPRQEDRNYKYFLALSNIIMNDEQILEIGLRDGNLDATDVLNLMLNLDMLVSPAGVAPENFQQSVRNVAAYINYPGVQNATNLTAFLQNLQDLGYSEDTRRRIVDYFTNPTGAVESGEFVRVLILLAAQAHPENTILVATAQNGNNLPRFTLLSQYRQALLTRNRVNQVIRNLNNYAGTDNLPPALRIRTISTTNTPFSTQLDTVIGQYEEQAENILSHTALMNDITLHTPRLVSLLTQKLRQRQ